MVDPGGTFTYTPTDGARHAAVADEATLAERSDTFDITINDAHGGVTTVPVTVSVQGANAEPTLDVVVSSPDTVTGVVIGEVTGTDPDGDTVTTTPPSAQAGAT